MLCAVIKGPAFHDIIRQIRGLPVGVDLIELRLDGFVDLDESALTQVRALCALPMIFTLRKKDQGGAFTGSEEARLAAIRQFVKFQPEYLDLESDIEPSFVKEINSQYPEIKIILSYHNFENTPDDLNLIYCEMQKLPAFFYKIAARAETQVDALRLLHLAKEGKGKVLTMSMGLEEEPTRILGPVFGCPVTYAAAEEGAQSAKGQFNVKTMLDVYHFSSLNESTKIYGLIGNPVDGSISHYTHNTLFSALGINAVYIKIPLPSESRILDNFLKSAGAMGFGGLSVTMPLKEIVVDSLSYIDPAAKEIGAVNTLLFECGGVSGFNTDGIGALNAIENVCPVNEKKIIILGAGGAAKAIAFEACLRGGQVIILNRDPQKAHLLAQRLFLFSPESGGLDRLKYFYESGYDILINCTPHVMPINPDYIDPRAVVMDIHTQPKDTELLKKAKQAGCQVIYGYKMFIEQALGQYAIWFKGGIEIDYARKILEDTIYRLELS